MSLSPSVTEILHGVGAFGRVVAVSDYCDFPPEVERLPRVGAWMNTNIEQLAALRPDLVIMTDAQAAFIEDSLKALGIATLVVPSQSLADVFTAIDRIGDAVGNRARAQELASETRALLDGIRARTRDLPHPRVLTVVDRLPGTLRDLYVATRGSFLVEIVEVAGGEPITPPAPMGYTPITAEALVSFDPDVILDIVQAVSPPVTLLGERANLGEDPLEVWGELRQVRAVRERRIYPIREKSIVHPSQLVGEWARRIAGLLHPEALQDRR